MAPTEGLVEHLRVPVRWWLLAALFWGSLLVACLVAIPNLVGAIAPALVLFALNAAFFASYGSARLALETDDAGAPVLRAGRAWIPVSQLASPVALDASETRRVLGVDADARAYLLVRPYLKSALRVVVVDPTDPAPYWLLNTRQPHRWVEALAWATATSPQKASGPPSAAPRDGAD